MVYPPLGVDAVAYGQVCRSPAERRLYGIKRQMGADVGGIIFKPPLAKWFDLFKFERTKAQTVLPGFGRNLEVHFFGSMNWLPAVKESSVQVAARGIGEDPLIGLELKLGLGIKKFEIPGLSPPWLVAGGMQAVAIRCHICKRICAHAKPAFTFSEHFRSDVQSLCNKRNSSPEHCVYMHTWLFNFAG